MIKYIFIFLIGNLYGQTIYKNPVQEVQRNQDSTYTFYYRNMEYKTIVDIQYISMSVDFVDTCLSVIETGIETTYNEILIKKYKSQVYIYHNGSYCYIKQKTLTDIRQRL